MAIDASSRLAINVPTQAGQARARTAGKHMLRPANTSPEQRRAIRHALAAGATVSSMVQCHQVRLATIIAIHDCGR